MPRPDGAAHPSSPILVVDDDAAVRGLIAETLLAEGYTVVEAEGGDHALRLLATESFAAAVLDRTMPGLDGIEVLHWIRRTAATALLPVVLVTGRDDPADIVEGLEVGADDYLVKPFEPTELVARIRRHVAGTNEWSLIVEREVERRRALTDTARSAGAVGPVDQAAMQLCDGLVQLPEAAGAMVAEVVGDGLSAIATKGTDPFELLSGRSSPTNVGQRIAHRSRQGAWLEPAVERGTDQATAVAVAPIVVDDAPVALVLVAPEPGLARDDLDRMLAIAIDFASLAAGMLGTELRDTAAKDAARQRFLSLVERHDFATVFQPVFDVNRSEIVGYEALTRFDPPGHSRADTEAIFTGAALVGAGRVVELRTLEAAIAEAAKLPAGVWLSVNASPSLIVSRSGIAELLDELDGRPLVVEVSELEPVDDYAELRAAIDDLGTQVQLSIDDAGSGYATLSHVLTLGAHYIKIDHSWIHGIDADPGKRALVSGIQNFASETGALVVAEGIETETELATVRDLGITLGQGYLLGRPDTADLL